MGQKTSRAAPILGPMADQALQGAMVELAFQEAMVGTGS